MQRPLRRPVRSLLLAALGAGLCVGCTPSGTGDDGEPDDERGDAEAPRQRRAAPHQPVRAAREEHETGEEEDGDLEPGGVHAQMLAIGDERASLARGVSRARRAPRERSTGSRCPTRERTAALTGRSCDGAGTRGGIGLGSGS